MWTTQEIGGVVVERDPGGNYSARVTAIHQADPARVCQIRDSARAL
jgi:hypothetical protein